MAFGSPYKYVYLNPSESDRLVWDTDLKRADDKFKGEEHNICW